MTPNVHENTGVNWNRQTYDNTHDGDYLKKPVATAITALVFLILSIGLLIAGAITGGLGLGLYVFIPLLVVGAAGTIGMSVLLSKV